MKKHLISFLFLFINFIFFGQNLPDIIPVSPEVSMFKKRLEVPINISTGVPNISIPLFTLQGSEISIPLSLTYHAGGIKVNQIASRVGLGWDLSFGGVVTRTVRGFPDDSGTGMLNNNKFEHFDGLTDREKIETIFYSEQFLDFESDIYNFNFFGHTGKFFFTPSGELKVVHKNDLKIIVNKITNGIILGFVIIDEIGTKYYFGISKDSNEIAVNKSTVSSFKEGYPQTPLLDFSNYITSWNLLNIETANKQLTTYSYGSTLYTYFSLGGQTKYITTSGEMGRTETFTTYLFTNEIVTKINSISNKNGHINFIYDTNFREDLMGDHSMISVELYNNVNNLINKYNFNYDYFISNQHHNGSNVGFLSQRRKRLYLKNIFKVNSNDSINEKYDFIYNTTHILPDRMSFSQDYFGYYNGVNNQYLYPTVDFFNGNSSSKFSTFPGADKKVYEKFAKSCVLNKIIYPTGGIVEYEYESNRANGLQHFLKTNMIEEFIVRNNPNETLNNIITTDTVINLNNLPGTYLTFNVNFDYECIDSSSIFCPKAELIIVSDNGDLTHLDSTNGENINRKINLVQEDGDIKLRIKTTSFSNDNKISVEINGLKFPPNTENAVYVGGLRVKSIKHTDDGNIILNKKYNYVSFDDHSKSSGYMPSYPIFFAKLVLSDKLTSIPIYQSVQDSFSTYYTNVTEINESTINGKIEYKNYFVFDMHPIQNSSGYMDDLLNEVVVTRFPIPDMDFSHKRGLLISKSIYEKEQNNYNIKSKDSIDYHRLGFEVTKFYKIADGYMEYYNISERYNKTNINKIKNNVTINKKYLYDNSFEGRNFPIQTETTTSDNKTIITKINYPKDMLGQEPYMQELINANRIAEPIKTSIYKKEGITESLLSYKKTIYDQFTNNHILPKFIKSAKGSDVESNLETRIIYHKYDNSGNPLDLSKADGTRISYIWGYNKTKPIAKLVNIAYDDIPQTQLNTLLNFNYIASSETFLLGVLSSLRNALPNDVQVTTMTYKPLIGVSTITDPKGDIQTYHYDNFNRLEYVKDAEGNILSKNEYHYRIEN